MSIGQFQTVKDVADMLKVGEATVRRWIRDGELRAIDIGRGWRIAPEDLDDFLRQNANRPHRAATEAGDRHAVEHANTGKGKVD